MFGYEQAAGRAVEWLTGQLDDIGSYRGAPDDLACYYKSPCLLSLSGRPREASRLLSYVRRRFGTDDGDFRTTVGHKSDNAVFDEYWAYPNGWLAMAAQRMGRFDIAYPSLTYLRGHLDARASGARTGRLTTTAGATVDALTTAHLGMVCLCFGDVAGAVAAGRWLQTS